MKKGKLLLFCSRHYPRALLLPSNKEAQTPRKQGWQQPRIEPDCEQASENKPAFLHFFVFSHLGEGVEATCVGACREEKVLSRQERGETTRSQQHHGEDETCLGRDIRV